MLLFNFCINVLLIRPNTWLVAYGGWVIYKVLCHDSSATAPRKQPTDLRCARVANGDACVREMESAWEYACFAKWPSWAEGFQHIDLDSCENRRRSSISQAVGYGPDDTTARLIETSQWCHRLPVYTVSVHCKCTLCRLYALGCKGRQ